GAGIAGATNPDDGCVRRLELGVAADRLVKDAKVEQAGPQVSVTHERVHRVQRGEPDRDQPQENHVTSAVRPQDVRYESSGGHDDITPQAVHATPVPITYLLPRFRIWRWRYP